MTSVLPGNIPPGRAWLPSPVCLMPLIEERIWICTHRDKGDDRFIFRPTKANTTEVTRLIYGQFSRKHLGVPVTSFGDRKSLVVPGTSGILGSQSPAFTCCLSDGLGTPLSSHPTTSYYLRRGGHFTCLERRPPTVPLTLREQMPERSQVSLVGSLEPSGPFTTTTVATEPVPGSQEPFSHF